MNIRIDYPTTVFPLEGDKKLHTRKRLQLAYVDNTSTVEIVGWGISVNLEQATDLPFRIARRFVELFDRTQAGETLSEHDEACFRTICEQIDYRRFCADRDLPRYEEALLVRKNPPLLRFLPDKNIRLRPEIARKLDLLRDGDAFGAYFSRDDHGEITNIEHIRIVPSPETVLSGLDSNAYRSLPGDFPDSLRSLLPGPVPPESEEAAE
jgi:hypothetical protein